MQKRIKVGIIGAGYVCRHHINALRSLEFVTVAAIADIDESAAKGIASEFGIPIACRGIDEFSELDIDAVFVLTPPDSHCALAVTALEAGYHVFVEKPMADTATECQKMIDAAEKHGLTLAVNHSDRLDPVILRSLDLVREGVCGEIIAVDLLRGSEYPPFAGGQRRGPYKKGSYPFQDLGVHCLYLLEAFLGPVNKLAVEYRNSGTCSHLLFDEWYGDAHCEKGHGRMHLSWSVRPMQNRVIIQGTKGVIEVDRFLQTITVSKLRPGPKFIGMIVNAISGSIKRVFAVCWSVLKFATKRLPRSPGIYAGAIDFAEAISEGRKPVVSAEEGMRIVTLMEPVLVEADEKSSRIFQDRLRALPSADVLVTGAGGFLGGALLRRLVADHRSVRVLLRREIPWIGEIPGVQVVIGDLGDPEIVDHAIDGVNVVYHIGAAMGGGPESFRAGTTMGVQNIVESCLKHAIKKLVYVSSMSVFQVVDRPLDKPVREDSEYEKSPGRRGLYTQTKLVAERFVLDAIANRRLPAVVLRPGQIFGPGAEATPANGVIGLGSLWILVGDGQANLPLVFVDDVVDALVAAEANDDATGKVFNVVDETPVTQREYVDACKSRLGSRIRVIRAPTFLMLMAATGLELLGKILKRDVPVTRYRVRSLQPLAGFDLSAAREHLKWQPAIGTAVGMERTFAGSDTGENQG